MYYIAVSNICKVNVGERVILKEDKLFEEVCAVRPSGEVVGNVVSFPIEGCLSKDCLSVAICDNSIPCSVIIKSGDITILCTDGNPSAQTLSYSRSNSLYY